MPDAIPDAPSSNPSTGAAPDEGGYEIALNLSIPAQVDLRRVPTAFGADAGTWLGEPTEPRARAAADDSTGRDASDMRRFVCDLRLRVSPEGRALFRKSAIVGLGTPRSTPAGWLVPIEWQAASMAPLFPVFAGHLRIGPGRIAIDGFYAPPFGVAGYLLDRAVLSIVAHGTARWFLTQVVDALS